MTSLEDWNDALLRTLLPEQGDAATAVLLACDDQAVAAAAARLSISADKATGALIAAVRDEYQITTARGLTAVNAQITRHLKLGHPRPVPPFLAALCVTVLAASRMNRDERLNTNAYYQRLCDLLGTQPLDVWPAVAGFKPTVLRGMSLLQNWLTEDQLGRRGELLVPDRPKPSLVGIPISQTLLRGRDRDLLGTFFSAHAKHLRSGYDPVLLLRRWSGRERLTQHAQDVLADPELGPGLGAAIRSALRAWDGTFTESGTGRRLLAGELQLAPTSGQLGLRLAVPALTEPAAAVTRAGQEIALRPYPDAVGLPIALLEDARTGPVSLDLKGASSAVTAIPGSTVLFAMATGGLEQTPAAGDDPVWILTADPKLQAVIPEGPRRLGVPLPDGWALLVDVDPSDLPDSARVTERDGAPVQGATLGGGLPLGSGAWLVDHPPRVLCDVPEPAPVTVNGRDFGYLDPGEPLTLDMLRGRAGTHVVEVADVYRLELELRDRGLRDGIGSLARYPDDPRLQRAGAIADARAADAEGARVAGAAITGAPAPEWQEPLLVSFNATVHVIYRDGSVRPCAPSEPPMWLSQVGLAHASDRWEIPDGRDAAWLCVASDRHPRVVPREPVNVPLTDEALHIADWFADAQVIGDDQDQQRWSRLVAAAQREEEPVDAS